MRVFFTNLKKSNKIKTMTLKRLLPFLGFFFIISQTYATELVSTPPLNLAQSTVYQPGERLVYKVTYMGIPAGEAVMAVLDKTEMNGRESFHILSTVESNDFVSFFYPVQDRIESFIDAEALYSHAIKIKQRQGKKRREKVIDFDQVEHRALQTKKDKGGLKEEVFDIPPQVQDSLSALYYFRMHQDLVVGQSVYIPVHESDKNWKLEIKVLSRESLKTALGTFDTIKVKALVRYQGVFMDKGDVTLWLTDDEKHIPVHIETKIKIGHIDASLVSMDEANRTFARIEASM